RHTSFSRDWSSDVCSSDLLSGAATPDDTGRSIVLSLQRLKRVRAVDTVNDSITVEAGCTLAEVRAAAQAAGRLFPLSLPSEGSRSEERRVGQERTSPRRAE